MSYTLIATDQALVDLRKSFQARNIQTIAMDFEGEFNLHCYGEHLCLIQIFDGTNSYIVDPLKISPVELKNTLESEALVKLFYGAASDYALVFKKYQIRMARVVDLQCHVDVLNLPGKGLDSVLQVILSIPPANKKKFQMHNWMHRPINPEALVYALGDVIHLFTLRDALQARVEEAGLLEELSARQKAVFPEFNYDPTPRIYKTPEFRDLNKRAQEILKALFEWRDATSQGLNCSPENLLRKSLLFTLARNPDSVKSLRPQNELNPRLFLELQSVLTKIKI
ncbi:MAG: hypothetical protein A2Z96_05025 [Spirochaetes bacterium GWB1_48_6]|nr:MAG: hypothetical protein A2Z96_05025 [Spirochaetes bacterium GWB1_48_6]